MIHPAEEAMFRAFARTSKRDRLVAIFGNPKRRKQAVDDLNHSDLWDPRYEQPVASNVTALYVLRDAGAPLACHIISGADELDGRDMPLEEAVEACENFDFASILCCIPGELAFFFDEAAAPRPRILLRRSPVHSQG